MFVEVKWKSLSEREVRGILRNLERKVSSLNLMIVLFMELVTKRVEGKEGSRGKTS
ncbi:putative protein fused ATPase/unknown protein domain protein [Pyrococcus sp. NA2]|nr:putative protein fused ATPase/unknown protein domain protein [Pyrococcus sp. NA2]